MLSCEYVPHVYGVLIRTMRVAFGVTHFWTSSLMVCSGSMSEIFGGWSSLACFSRCVVLYHDVARDKPYAICDWYVGGISPREALAMHFGGATTAHY